MASADLAVTKTASLTTAAMGQQITYTITVTNNGPDAATGVTLTDNVPGKACLNAIALSPEVGSYTYTGNTIKWSIGDLAAHSAVTMSVIVTARAAGALANTANVSGNETDPDPGNNSATAAVTVTGTDLPAADLAAWKTSCPEKPMAGSNFTYYISAINNGPAAASGVYVVDPLPPGLVPISASSSKGVCSINSSTVICTLGAMEPNARADIAIVVKAAVADSYQNTAYILSDKVVPDPNPGNNSAEVITIVSEAADLAITKTASPPTVILGQDVTYTITVTNHGPSSAAAVTVTDSLPPQANVKSITASQGTGCTPLEDNKYLCTLGTIAAGHTATITVSPPPLHLGLLPIRPQQLQQHLTLTPAITRQARARWLP